MSDPTTSSESAPAPSRAEVMTGMFASLVMQNTNMALIFLGQAPNPQTGQKSQDLDSAQYFIDQLEMLEIKTKGNLNPQEQAILKQSLTNLRLMFVEMVNRPQTPAPAPAEPAPKAPETDEEETPVIEPALPGETQPPPPEATAPKKFSKKYT